jgi:hypothetical protein
MPAPLKVLDWILVCIMQITKNFIVKKKFANCPLLLKFYYTLFNKLFDQLGSGVSSAIM